MFFFGRTALLRLAAAAVKAQDKLATLGLDGSLASRKKTPIRAKKNIRYEFAQPQNALTSTGLLMEGQIVLTTGTPGRSRRSKPSGRPAPLRSPQSHIQPRSASGDTT